MRPTKIVEIAKRLTDVLIGVVGCFFLVLLYPFIGFLIKLESPGTIIYKQIRVGINRRKLTPQRKALANKRKDDKGGTLFTIYKFRTMATDAEKSGPQLWKRGTDLRVTRVGKMMRALHLDELPQFYNILRGDMSFIGPRPERPFFTKQYIDSIPNYSERTLNIKPGLTGLAQIVLGYDDDLNSVVKKSHYDFSYRASMSSFSSWLKMEVWVYLNTILYIFHVSALLRRNQYFEGKRARGELPLPEQNVANSVERVFVHDTRHSDILTLRGKSPSAISEKLMDIEFGGVKDLRVCLSPTQLDLKDLGALLQLMDQVKRLGGKLSIKDAGPEVKALLKEIKLNNSVKIYSDSDTVANFLTIDVECWFHANNLRSIAPHSSWHKLDTNIIQNTERLLTLLERHHTKATFFVLGWVADYFPEVVKMIDSQGHHIGVRGYYHNLVAEMTPNEFEDDLKKTIEAVSPLINQQIDTARASNFSITPDTLWALEIMNRYGIKNDSSIYPVYRGSIGYRGYPNRFPHQIHLENNEVMNEVPLSITEILGRELPIGGGGFFRLYPYWMTARYLERLNQKGLPGVVYIQPWELDVNQAKYNVGMVKGFRHYVNLEKTEDKLNRILEQFRFQSVKENLQDAKIQKIMDRHPVYLKTLGVEYSNFSEVAKALVSKSGQRLG